MWCTKTEVSWDRHIPACERYLSIVNTRKKRSKDAVLRKFDFIETFNACESQESNDAARKLAEHFMKPGFGGSDSHRYDCIGTAYTELPREIRRESDLDPLYSKRRGGILRRRSL